MSGAPTTEHLVRLLNLLPYFEHHPDRTLTEAAMELGVDFRELKKDLELLSLCGPGMLPDELVDLEATFDGVRVINNQGLAMPLRLTPTEAGALLLYLERLEALGGLVDPAALQSATNKLRALARDQALGVFDSTAGRADLITSPTSSPVIQVAQQAVAAGHRLGFDYTTKVNHSHREVSVVWIFTHEGHSYVQGYDHARGAHRTFRVDRMSGPHVIPEPATPKQSQLMFDSEDPFNLRGAPLTVTLQVAAGATWLVDYLLADESTLNEDGSVTVTLSAFDLDWCVDYCLAHADRVTVLGPAELTTRLAERLKMTYELYR